MACLLYAFLLVFLYFFVSNLIPMDENQNEIVRHKRLYGDHKQQSMKWLPYLRQLAKRPGALKYSGIYNIMPENMKKYLDKCKKSERWKILSVIAILTEKMVLKMHHKQ
ncbi:hypothetical protein EQM13_17910 [Acidilutibacter cellobiosedens]|jgi:hypothetical protein|uniref:Uncharacterized protein n=1 Tax=Acidilutibacter cellobiosedens TaxID=2507161 RepID=A0A410QGS4_9FIRM|nr:hypothetical protein [Acidilutibacter cellobiosedens]QAT63302.1 hypothetical protein EQM13_17910 [Acidilutibacter cellobiosedens]